MALHSFEAFPINIFSEDCKVNDCVIFENILRRSEKVIGQFLCEDRYYEKCRSFKYYNVEFNLVNYDKYEGSL